MAPSGIRKFFELASREKDIISLGIGEPDFETPYLIKDRGIAAIELNHTHYTENAGLFELREKIAEKLKQENRIDATAGDVLITSGSSEGLDISLRAILNPGDEVLMLDPSYVAYAPLIALAGGKPVLVPTREEDEFSVRVEEIEKRIGKRTKALLICSPNNPTGTVMEKERLKAIADLAIERDLVVISDEIYEKMVYEGRHYSIASLPEMAERTITLNGFSKAYAATGWRVGYVVAKGEIMDAIYKIHQYCALCAPTPSQYAMLAAFEEGASVENLVSVYNARRKLIVRKLNELSGVSCRMPKGAFYAFPNIKGTGMSSEEFAERMIREAKVAVVPGNVFGPSGEGYVRISYSVSTENIIEALSRMGRVLG